MAEQSTLMLSDNKLFRCHRVYTFYVCMGFHPLRPLGIRDECNIAHCTLQYTLFWLRGQDSYPDTHTHSHQTSHIVDPLSCFKRGGGRRHWVSEYINKSIPTHGLIANACRKTEGQKPTTPPITTKCLLLRCFIVDSKSKCIAFHPPSLRPSPFPISPFRHRRRSSTNAHHRRCWLTAQIHIRPAHNNSSSSNNAYYYFRAPHHPIGPHILRLWMCLFHVQSAIWCLRCRYVAFRK